MDSSLDTERISGEAHAMPDAPPRRHASEAEKYEIETRRNRMRIDRWIEVKRMGWTMARKPPDNSMELQGSALKKEL
jgi:hypothetical protein